MKKTWKVLSNTTKRQALKDVRTLIAEGSNITAARTLVAKKLNVRPNTIANWEHKRDFGQLNTTNDVISNITRTRITSVNLHVPGKGNITLDHDLLQNIAQLAGHVG